MITKINFEDMLCKSAELFSFSKKHTDLFVLLQTNTVTYQQLALSHIHGASNTSARLSLKRLEKSGYVQAKELTKHNNEKYYFLTANGRNWIRSAFPHEFLDQMKIAWSRRPPSGSQQILHRIRTNDFYFSYIAAKESVPRIWVLEHPLFSESKYESSPARCDALFSGINRDYYIEQDNNTQSENVIQKKISQYAEAGFFNPVQEKPPVLIFCLSFPTCSHAIGTAPFSIYRLLLKFCKFWSLLEQIHGIELDYEQFINSLKVSSLGTTVSSTEFLRFELLHNQYPDVYSLTDLVQLKNAYLADSTNPIGLIHELDVFYRKRLKSHYSALYKSFSCLREFSRHAVPLFAVPNHRLTALLPFILSKELGLDTKLKMYLHHKHLVLDGWKYSSPISITIDGTKPIYFFAGLSHPYLGYLIIEIPYHDLSALPRIEQNIISISSLQNISFLFFTDSNYFNNLKDFCQKKCHLKSHTVLTTDIYLAFDKNAESSAMYRIDNDTDVKEVYFETDLFYGKLRTIEKGDVI